MLPFLQLAEKYMTTQSKVVARGLGIKQTEAIGLGAQLFAFVIDFTSTEDVPPSGIVLGDDAADIIEAGMGYEGEPGLGAATFIRAGVVERVEGGLRVKGCDRYADAWGNRETRSEKAKAAADARWSKHRLSKPEASPEHMHVHASSNAQPMLGDAKTETYTETYTETDNKPQQQAAAAGLESSDFEADSDGAFKPTAWGFWGWHNLMRQKQELFDEGQPPYNLRKWHDAAVAKVRADGLVRSYLRFLGDKAFAVRGWPFAVFMSDAVWLPRANPEPETRPRL